MVYITNVENVEEEVLKKGNAKETKVKYLVDSRHGAERFFLRIYKVEPGGRTPYDKHNYEHEVFVLQGTAKLVTVESGDKKEYTLKEGDVVYIAPNEVHQFVNEGSSTFKMLCVRGSEIKDEINEGC